MSFVPKKPNVGTLFPNSRKEPGSSHPDMTGNMFLDRVMVAEQLKQTPVDEYVKFDISGWDNGGRIGLGISKPYVKPAPQPEPEQQPAPPADDSDIPF